MNAMRTYKTLAVTLLVGAAALLSGCQSIHPGWSSLAYVEIEDASLEAVHAATLQVFAGENYAAHSVKPREIVFVREGTPNDRLQYARYQESLQMRVEVTLEPFGDDGVLVRADAYAVVGASGRDEVQLLKIARRPYRLLLNRVKETVRAEAMLEAL